MKNSKMIFILTEAVLAVTVVILASIMLLERNGRELKRISVIVQNSDQNQWSAFKYGLRMAAEDQKIELSIVSTGGTLTAEDEINIIEREVKNGADAIIVQPVPGLDTEQMLTKMKKKAPLMLVEYMASEDDEADAIPVTEPDNYAMGMALAEELKKDQNGKLEGKTLGIVSETAESEAVIMREKGFRDALADTGAEMLWQVSGAAFTESEYSLEAQPKVDFVIAFDNNSFVTAGKDSTARNLHGALVYGIGTSTEAVYYLDVGSAECLLVPDEFSIGYRSLTEAAESLKHWASKMESRTIGYTVMRRDMLFSKKNQEILFTMSQ